MPSAAPKTNELFQTFLNDNQTEQFSVQSGGDQSINTNELFKKFLNENQTEQLSVQSGGDSILYNSIDSDLMSTGTIDIFTNFLNKNKFKKHMQFGGENNKKKKPDKTLNKGAMSIKQAVDLLKKHYD